MKCTDAPLLRVGAGAARWQADRVHSQRGKRRILLYVNERPVTSWATRDRDCRVPVVDLTYHVCHNDFTVAR